MNKMPMPGPYYDSYICDMCGMVLPSIAVWKFSRFKGFFCERCVRKLESENKPKQDIRINPLVLPEVESQSLIPPSFAGELEEIVEALSPISRALRRSTPEPVKKLIRRIRLDEDV